MKFTSNMIKKLSGKKAALLSILLTIMLGISGSAADKLTVTKKNMETIGGAIEAYAEVHEKYPEAFSMDELSRVLGMQPGDLPFADGWGNKLHYLTRTIRTRTEEYSHYWLGSGTTGEFGGFLGHITKAPQEGTDLIYSDGAFKTNPHPEHECKRSATNRPKE